MSHDQILQNLDTLQNLRTQKVYALSRKLVAFVGVHAVYNVYLRNTDNINNIEEDTSTDSSHDSVVQPQKKIQVDDMMACFYDMEEADIIDICNEIYDIQEYLRVSNNISLISPSSPKLPENLTVYKNYLSSKKFEAFNDIQLLISRYSLKSNTNHYAWITSIKSAQLRNAMIKGKILITAADQGESEDTLGNVQQINTHTLEEVLKNNLKEFVTNFFMNEQHLYPIEDTELNYLLKFTEVLIENKKGFDLTTRFIASSLFNFFDNNFYLNLAELSPEQLATKVREESTQQNNLSFTFNCSNSMQQCLGRSLPILKIPCDTFLFTSCTLEAQRKHLSLNKVFTSECNKRENISQKQMLTGDKSIDIEKLKQNYQKIQDNPDRQEVFLNEIEHALVINFFNKFNSTNFSKAYQLMCQIEWGNKLSVLFNPKSKTKKLPLSTRTITQVNQFRATNPECRPLELISCTSQEQTPTDNTTKDSASEFITSNEYDTIILVDENPKHLTDDQKNDIYQFYINNTQALEAGKLKNEWLNIIYDKTFSENDFFHSLALALTPLYAHNKEVKCINLKLIQIKKDDEFLERSTITAISQFSTLYGPLLLELKEQYPKQFTISYEYHSASKYPCALTDFVAFDEDTKSKIKNTSKKKVTLKFQLEVEFVNHSPSYKTNISWLADFKSIGLHTQADLKNMCELAFKNNKLDGQTIRQASTDELLNANSPIFGKLSTKQNLILKNHFVANIIEPNSVCNGISLLDIDSFMPGEYHQVGFFTPKNIQSRESNAMNLSYAFKTELEKISSPINNTILLKFNNFEQLYLRVLICLYFNRLSSALIDQCVYSYASLQNTVLLANIPSASKKNLLTLIQNVGLATELRNENLDYYAFNTAYIATPFHIESLKHQVLRTEQLKDMINHIFKKDVTLFDTDTIQSTLEKNFLKAQSAPYLVAPAKNTYTLFAAIQSVNGYVLYEPFNQNKLEQEAFTEHSSSKNNNLQQFASDYKKQTGIADEEQSSNLLKSFTNIIEDYLNKNHKLQDEFDILIYNCSYFALAHQIYKSLSQSKKICNGYRLINLYFVNDNSQDCSVLYKNFEHQSQLRYQQHETEPATLNTYVLSAKQFTELQNHKALNKKFLQENGELCRFKADISVLFHSFDSLAELKFKKENIFLSKSNTFNSLLQEDNSRYSFSEDYNARIVLTNNKLDLSDIVSIETLLTLSDQNIDEVTMQKISQLVDLRLDQEAEYNKKYLQGISLNVQLPQLVLNMDKLTVKSLLENVHAKSDIVLSFDSLIGKRQMHYQNINVVHYQQSAKLNANILLSTKQNFSFYLKNLEQHLSSYCPQEQLSKENQQLFSNVIFDEVVSLSGNMLMRGENSNLTNEMLGLVFSKYIVNYFYKNRLQLLEQNILGKDCSFVLQGQSIKTFIFLDDYQSLFGLNQQQRADILVIELHQEQSQTYPTLELTIIESKYGYDINSTKKTIAKSQINNTINRFAQALYSEHSYLVLDKSVFLGHFADMLLDTSLDLKNNTDEQVLFLLSCLRSGKVNISLKGIILAFEYETESKDIVTSSTFNRISLEYLSKEQHHSKIKAAMSISPKPVVQKLFNFILKDALNTATTQETSACSKLSYLHDPKIDEIFVSVFNFLHKQEVKPFNLDHVSFSSTLSTSQNNSNNSDLLFDNTPNFQILQDHQQSTLDNNHNENNDTPSSPLTLATSTFSICDRNISNISSSSSDTIFTQTEEKLNTHITSSDVSNSIYTANIENQEEHEEFAEQVNSTVSFWANDDQNCLKQTIYKTLLQYCYPKTFAYIYDEPHAITVLDTPERQAWAQKTKQKMKELFANYGFYEEPYKEQYTSSGLALYYHGSKDFPFSKLKTNIESFKSVYSIDIIYITHCLGYVLINLKAENEENQVVHYLNLWKNRTFDFTSDLDVSQLNDILTKVQQAPNKQQVAYMALQQLGLHSRILIGLNETNGDHAYIEFFKNSNPHILIAGQSGGGKSILIQNILLELIMLNFVNNIHLLIIDPKEGAEFNLFKDIPHIQKLGIVYDIDDVLQHIKAIIEEMDNRNNLFRTSGHKNIQEYNNEVHFDKRLPHLVICFDEVADFLDKSTPKQATEMTQYLQRLVQKGRSTGIYVILATQRPSHDVISLKIRTNCGNRLSFKVNEKGTSDIILGKTTQLDATRLSATGHIAAYIESKESLIQAAFLETKEAYKLLEVLKQDLSALPSN